MTQTNVFDIRLARSYVPNEADRLVRLEALANILDVSTTTVKNYARGKYWKAGEWCAYPAGPMPSKRLPGGQFRFNVDDCMRWVDSHEKLKRNA